MIGLRAAARPPFVQAVKSALATVLAWVVAGSIVHGELPVFASVAAVLVVQPSVNQSVGRAVERSIGVVVGVLLAVVVGLAFGDDYWIVLLAIVLAIVLAWLVRLTPTTAVQIPISAMLVLSVGADTATYAVDRVTDTVIGAAIGILVNLFVVPPVALAPARQALDTLVAEIASRLDALAGALSSPRTPAELEELLVLARLLRPMRERTTAAIQAAQDSLSLNPRRNRYLPRLEELDRLLTTASHLVTRTLGITRTVHDHYRPALVAEPTVAAVAGEIRRAAHDLRLLQLDRPACGDGAPEVPTLTAPLTVAAPDPANWVLIGALIEDLRRIHEEITGADAG